MCCVPSHGHACSPACSPVAAGAGIGLGACDPALCFGMLIYWDFRPYFQLQPGTFPSCL